MVEIIGHILKIFEYIIIYEFQNNQVTRYEMENNEVETKTIICITTDANTYTVKADQGVSVPEMAFATMVLIRTLLNGKYIESKDDFIKMVNKYFDDPQYMEVQDGTDDERESDS